MPRPPDIATPLAVDVDGQIRLGGYSLDPLGGGRYQLTLWWQALRQPDDRYAVFVHVLDGQDRRVWQADGEPLDALFPTNEWPAGRWLPDVRTIDLSTLPAGRYAIYIGMYEWGGGYRLPIPATAGTRFPDAYLLVSIDR
jgi:hypothetical protein